MSFALKAAVFFQFDASLAYPETENFTKFGVTPAKSGNAPGGVLVGGTSNGPVAVKRSRHFRKRIANTPIEQAKMAITTNEIELKFWKASMIAWELSSSLPPVLLH